MKLYISASDCNGVGSTAGIHFVNAFSAFPHILKDTSGSQKRHPFSADFNRGNRQKSAAAGQDSMGDAIVLCHCPLL